MQTRKAAPMPDILKPVPALPPLAPLRFRGNRANPNYAAVTHLLRTYARHLGMALQEAGAAAEGPVDVLWDMGLPPKPDGACLVFPGRPHADAETACARTRSGYPVPLSGSGIGGLGEPGVQKGGVLETVGGYSLAWEGDEGWNLRSDWDLLSFCADILFRRADHHPSRGRAAREAISLDQWDRAFGLTEEPWVDRWMFRLLGALPRLRSAVDALPSQARIWLTHDLDNLAKWRPRSVAGQILRTPAQLARGRFAPLAQAWAEIAKRALTGKDPYDVMDQIMRMEAGRRSANFFLANGRDHLFHRYDLARPRFRRVMLDCLRQGMDVGLHGQVHFISDLDAIRAEKGKMERLAGAPVSLNRQHYLRWDPAATFAGLEAAGIRVDSTLGYNDSPGFRAGTAFPYLWFDCRTDKPTRLLEAPLILGEFQFYDPQAFDPVSVGRTLEKYMDAATRQGGVYTVLFHNNYFHEGDFPGQGAVYSQLLDMAGRRGLADFDPLGTHARYLGSDAAG